MFITAVPSTKLFASREGDSGEHVLRETTSRGLCGLVCPSRTSERGGKGYCVKEGGGVTLQALVECRVFEPEHIVRTVLLRRHSSGMEVHCGLVVGL